MDLRQSGNALETMTIWCHCCFLSQRKGVGSSFLDDSDNVGQLQARRQVHSQPRDMIEALHKLCPTLAFSKSTVLAALAAITEINCWKLEDDSATEAMHKILGLRLRNMCRHVSQAVGKGLLTGRCML